MPECSREQWPLAFPRVPGPPGSGAGSAHLAQPGLGGSLSAAQRSRLVSRALPLGELEGAESPSASQSARLGWFYPEASAAAGGGRGAIQEMPPPPGRLPVTCTWPAHLRPLEPVAESSAVPAAVTHKEAFLGRKEIRLHV